MTTLSGIGSALIGFGGSLTDDYFTVLLVTEIDEAESDANASFRKDVIPKIPLAVRLILLSIFWKFLFESCV